MGVTSVLMHTYGQNLTQPCIPQCNSATLVVIHGSSLVLPWLKSKPYHNPTKEAKQNIASSKQEHSGARRRRKNVSPRKSDLLLPAGPEYRTMTEVCFPLLIKQYLLLPELSTRPLTFQSFDRKKANKFVLLP